MILSKIQLYYQKQPIYYQKSKYIIKSLKPGESTVILVHINRNYYDLMTILILNHIANQQANGLKNPSGSQGNAAPAHQTVS